MKNRLLKYILSYLGIGLALFILIVLIIATSGYSPYERARTAETITPILFWTMIILLIYFLYRYMKLSVEREREELSIEKFETIKKMYNNPLENNGSFSGKSVNDLYKSQTEKSVNDKFK